MRTRRSGCLLVAGLAALTACSSAGAPEHARSGCFTYSVSTDRVLYRAGQPVHVVVEGRNVTSHTCLGPTCGGVTPWVEIVDGDGRTVYRTNPVGIQCARNQAPPPVVRPGRSTQWDAYTWSPEPGAAPSPGRYTARWHWMEDVSVRSPVINIVD